MSWRPRSAARIIAARLGCLRRRFAVIETEDAFKSETYLHHRLRTKRSTRSGATEFFEVDPDELSALVHDARHYVNEVLPTLAEAERLSEESCDNRILERTEGVLATY